MPQTEYQKQYYLEHKKEKLAYFKKKYAEDPQKFIKRSQKFHQAHPEVKRKADKTYSLNHPEKIKDKNTKRNATPGHKERVRESHLKRQYKLSLSEYHEIYYEQNGNCAICGSHQEKLMVDHNHDTGKVRGLLCTYCNTGLGFMKDNQDVLHKAIVYLKEND